VADPEAVARGRDVYNFRCYFCHGYDGNAQTVAAGMLDPKPRDFTRATDLDRGRIVAVLHTGKPGTAMKPFMGVLNAAEIADVATFVADTFVACGARNTAYHTEANGWPDHQARYGAAYDFATGTLPLDIPERLLEPAEKAGLALFRSTCISCHEGRHARQARLGLEAGAPAAADDPWSSHAEHDDDYETPTVHDIAPAIADPTPSELAGLALYSDACAECHAADGTGQSWIGKFLRPNPTDFTTPTFARGFDVGHFAAATLDPPAGTTMPRFRGVLSEAEARSIADYVRRAFIGGPAGG